MRRGQQPKRQFVKTGVITAAATAGLMSGSLFGKTSDWTSTTDQKWLNSANWDNGVPSGTNDIGSFAAIDPASSTVTMDFSDGGGSISTGAIVDAFQVGSHANLTFNGDSTGTLTLNGATVTVPYVFTNPSPNPPTVTTETQANTILSFTDTSTTANKNLTFNSNINLALTNSTNYILGTQGSGAESKPKTLGAGMPNLTIAGNISDSSPSVHAGITFLGGGNYLADGASLNLTGTNNTFSGGITVGLANGTQSGTLGVSVPGALPTTGNITINEQSELLILAGTGSSTFSAPGQNLILNGPGIRAQTSGALRVTGGSFLNDTPLTWAGNVEIGASSTGTNGMGPSDNDNGYVIITTASADSYLKITGNITNVGSTPGGFQDQGSGIMEFGGTNTYSGGTQIGNGGIIVDSGSNLGPGDLAFFATSTNSPTITLNNATQQVANLASFFTATSTSGVVNNPNTGFTQSLVLNGTALTVTEPGSSIQYGSYGSAVTGNSTFGYGAVSGLTSGISGTGSLILNSTSNHSLILTGPNTYTGGTTITAGTLSVANLAPGTSASNLAGAGSATGTNTVTVNSGGTLASGGWTAPANFNGNASAVAVTGGNVSGAVVVNSGGNVNPGGVNTVGQLYVGSLQANAGSKFTFDLFSPTVGGYDTLISAGNVTLDGSGAETVNIAGSSLTSGTFVLSTYAGLAGTGTTFTLGSTPGGTNTTSGVTTVTGTNHRNYSLATDGTELVLTITPTNNQYIWSTNGSANLLDGSGSWNTGSTSFYKSVPAPGTGTPSAPYPAYDGNPGDFDTVFGNGGSGGTISVTGSVTVGGNLIFGALASGQSYTFTPSVGTNSITTISGISASNNTTINAPVVLGASQSFSTDTGVTLTLTGGISESGGSQTLTKTGPGTVVLSGTGAGTYSGGTVVSQGTLQTTTAGVPAANGISVASGATLTFDQTTSGSYSGTISGAGNIVVSNIAGTGSPSVSLTSNSNSYSGSTTITGNGGSATGAKLVVSNINQLGSGAGGIILSGGTLQATAPLSFPLVSDSTFVTLATGTTSTVDTQGFNVTLGQKIAGSGNLNKLGTGTLTLTDVPSTTVIGTVAVEAGTLYINPPGDSRSFSFSANGNDEGNIELATAIQFGLNGGNFSGGGNIQVDSSGTQLISSQPGTVIGNSIALNNPSNVAGFTVNISASSLDTLEVDGGIVGHGAVDYTGGKGAITLGTPAGASTYDGGTTIDNSSGGSVTLITNNPLPANTDLHVTHTGVFDLNGFNQTVDSISAGSTNLTSVIQNSSLTTNSVLTITSTDPVAGNTTYYGVIQDQTDSPTLGINIGGIADLTLPSPELYSGPLNIVGGRIEITNIDTANASGVGVNTTGLGSTSAITIGTLSNPSGGGQLRFTGVGSISNSNVPTYATVSYVTANHPDAVTPTITLASMGGYNNGVDTSDLGAIRVDNSSALSLPNNIVFAADSSIDVTSSSFAILTGTLSGTGTLNSLGAGVLTLTGPNSPYTGGTTIQGGTLNVQSGSAIGTGPLQVNNTTNPGGSLTGTAVVLNLLNATQTVGSLSGAIASTPAGNTASINLSPTVLTVNQTTPGTYAGTIVGTGSLKVNGTAALTIASTGSISVPTTVNGQLAFGANAGAGILEQTLPSLTLGSGGVVTLANPGVGNHANRTVLVAPVTFSGGKIDLTANDLVLKGTTVSAAFTQLKAGFNAHAGYWNGTSGIVSSAAAGDATHLTTLGYEAGGSTFDGVSTASTDVIVKYTYYGDADLNGTVNGADYQQIDNGFGEHLTGWQNGDFNYDGVVDGSDYSLIDNTYNQITATGATPLAIVASPSDLVASAADSIASPAAVPEPTTLGLLGIGAMGLLGRRRRRNA